MTIAQIDQLITDNLADFSNIIPQKHRAVSSALLAYMSLLPKLKVLTIDTILLDRNYSINTELPVDSTITGAIVMLECKIANNNFAVGDVTTAPTPYPVDNGRTSEQGIGLQYTNVDNSTIKVMLSDQVHIKHGYIATADYPTNTLNIDPANWKLKVFVTYL